MSLLPAEQAQFSALIDGILATADLSTISAKKIRKELQAKLTVDISDKKDAVQELILERFDAASSAAAPPPPTPKPAASPRANGYTSPRPPKKVKSEPQIKDESAEPDDDSDATPPPKKKRKQVKSEAGMDDAKLAAKLQAEENSLSRATRGGGTKRKTPVKKKTPKKKSADRVKADDDSDLELNSDGEVKEKPKKGGFHKEYHLSAPLADLVGEAQLSRPQVVKKIWAYIKANDLQDPADKRQIICDDKLQLVFKQDKVHMFTMNKILGKQLYDIEE